MPSDSPGSLIQSSAASPGILVLVVGAWPSAWRRGVAPLVVPVRVVGGRAEAVAGGVDDELAPAEEVGEFSSPSVALFGRLAIGDVDREALGVLDAGAQQALGHLPSAPPAGMTCIDVHVLAGIGEPLDAALQQPRPLAVEAVGGDGKDGTEQPAHRLATRRPHGYPGRQYRLTR